WINPTSCPLPASAQVQGLWRGAFFLADGPCVCPKYPVSVGFAEGVAATPAAKPTGNRTKSAWSLMTELGCNFVFGNHRLLFVTF
ncbi:MAG: hypothetical protein SPI30_06350, partial [Prevotella sp.]|nr:hypothetical protein [Prevotella sp.]